mmetsp:Transcript_13871/g.23351  ORF Transcript_13871/g.23351 Transcript_13871/m.23351 type:complete len:272 (-) Transcript_13871:74-889(-)
MKERGVLRDVFGGGIEGRGALEIDPFPVREAFLESSTLLGKEEESADEEDLLDSSSSSPSSSSSSSSSPSPRLIPDERVVIEDAKSPVESADGGGLRSLFASSSDERRESTRQLKNTMRSSRIKELLRDYFNSPRCPVVIQPKGAPKAFTVSAAGFEIVNVAHNGSGLLIATWSIPNSANELDVLATTLGHDSADFQNFREYINKKTFFDKAELSREVSSVLLRNIGRIRYYLGKKASMKRVPELRFREYSTSDHEKMASMNKLINSIVQK